MQNRLFGQVVEKPELKVLAVAITLVLVVVCLAMSPVLIPTHFLMRKRYGLNGFYFNNHLWIGIDSFKPYTPPSPFATFTFLGKTREIY